MNEITIHAPATVANLVCGFDILGLALEEPYDVMTLRRSATPGVHIINRDAFDLPTDPTRNVAGVALLALMERLPEDAGFELVIEKHIMPGSGIGSSAASAAGVVVAANRLLEERFDDAELVQFAMHGEKLASGVKHADNIAPCIYGGVTLIRSIHPLDIVRLSHPELHITIVHPQIEVRTSDARQILRKQILLSDAIRQWGNIAGLVAGLLQHDYPLIGRSLEDVIIEPVRSILIPAFDEVKRRCREAGALGGGISGSGPSIFMLSRDSVTAAAVAAVMHEIYTRIGLAHHIHQTNINSPGIRTVSIA